MQNKPTAEAKSPNSLGGEAEARQYSRLLEEIRAMLKELATDVQSRWQRSLPVGEYLVDRWERARVLGFGEGASIYDSATVS